MLTSKKTKSGDKATTTTMIIERLKQTHAHYASIKQEMVTPEILQDLQRQLETQILHPPHLMRAPNTNGEEDMVRLLTCLCFVETLRLWAPETPPIPAQLLKSAFCACIDELARLRPQAAGSKAAKTPRCANNSNVYRIYLLESLVSVKSIVIIYDFEDGEGREGLLQRLFGLAFDYVEEAGRVGNKQVKLLLCELLIVLIEEAGGECCLSTAITSFLIKKCCGHRLGDEKSSSADHAGIADDDGAPSVQFARQIASSCCQALQLPVAKWFREGCYSFLGDAAATANTKKRRLQQFKRINEQLCQLAVSIQPSLIVGAVGMVQEWLSVDDAHVRMLVMETTAALWTAKGCRSGDVRKELPSLYSCWLERTNDKLSTVRTRWTQLALSIALTHHQEKNTTAAKDHEGCECLRLVVGERIVDVDGCVREAVLTELLQQLSHPNSTDSNHLHALTRMIVESGLLAEIVERCKDRVHAVRLAALKVCCALLLTRDGRQSLNVGSQSEGAWWATVANALFSLLYINNNAFSENLSAFYAGAFDEFLFVPLTSSAYRKKDKFDADAEIADFWSTLCVSLEAGAVKAMHRWLKEKYSLCKYFAAYLTVIKRDLVADGGEEAVITHRLLLLVTTLSKYHYAPSSSLEDCVSVLTRLARHLASNKEHMQLMQSLTNPSPCTSHHGHDAPTTTPLNAHEQLAEIDWSTVIAPGPSTTAAPHGQNNNANAIVRWLINRCSFISIGAHLLGSGSGKSAVWSLFSAAIPSFILALQQQQHHQEANSGDSGDIINTLQSQILDSAGSTTAGVQSLQTLYNLLLTLQRPQAGTAISAPFLTFLRQRAIALCASLDDDAHFDESNLVPGKWILKILSTITKKEGGGENGDCSAWLHANCHKPLISSFCSPREEEDASGECMSVGQSLVIAQSFDCCNDSSATPLHDKMNGIVERKLMRLIDSNLLSNDHDEGDGDWTALLKLGNKNVIKASLLLKYLRNAPQHKDRSAKMAILARALNAVGSNAKNYHPRFIYALLKTILLLTHSNTPPSDGEGLGNGENSTEYASRSSVKLITAVLATLPPAEWERLFRHVAAWVSRRKDCPRQRRRQSTSAACLSPFVYAHYFWDVPHTPKTIKATLKYLHSHSHHPKHIPAHGEDFDGSDADDIYTVHSDGGEKEYWEHWALLTIVEASLLSLSPRTDAQAHALEPLILFVVETVLSKHNASFLFAASVALKQHYHSTDNGNDAREQGINSNESIVIYCASEYAQAAIRKLCDAHKWPLGALSQQISFDPCLGLRRIVEEAGYGLEAGKGVLKTQYLALMIANDNNAESNGNDAIANTLSTNSSTPYTSSTPPPLANSGLDVSSTDLCNAAPPPAATLQGARRTKRSKRNNNHAAAASKS